MAPKPPGKCRPAGREEVAGSNLPEPPNPIKFYEMKQKINWRHCVLLALMAVGLYLVGGEVESEAVFLPSSRSGWLRSGRCTVCMNGGGVRAKSPVTGRVRPKTDNRKIVQ